MFDYETLKIIWWGFVGVLLIGFALTDGFDFGVGMMLPFIGKTDGERRVVINSIGSTWEGNQTWFIVAGGAIFAAWPLVYGAAFSGFYVALMLLLFSLFFRPVGFDYRSKVADTRWRNAWDWGLFAGGSYRHDLRRRLRQPRVPFDATHYAGRKYRQLLPVAQSLRSAGRPAETSPRCWCGALCRSRPTP